MNEIRVNSRLSIRQNYNRMNDQNTFSAGGQWMSNLVSFTIDQQVYISPLAQAFGGKSVFQAWTFSVRLRSFHGTNTNVNTFIDPNGRMQWGGYLSGLRYSAVAPAHNDSPIFSKYVVRGVVVDETGQGVWGIAFRIGEETVLSDTNGEFFTHVKNAKPLPLAVAADSSIQTSRWSLKSAPSIAQGSLDSAAGAPVRVTVQVAGLVARS
jgi:hypothetical protein